MPDGLSSQDVQDLQQIRGLLPQGDARAAKIDTLLQAQTQAETTPPAQSPLEQLFDSSKPLADRFRTADTALSGMGVDLAKGAIKKFAQPAAILSGAINKIPGVGETLAPSEGVSAFKQATQPSNLPQTLGGIGEQAGEMAVTGGPLKAGAEALATKLPWLGKFAAPAMRIGAEALNTGASAAAHGQPVGTSAAAGGFGGAVSEGLQWAAPKIAESSLGVTQRMRGHGRTIGEAALGETNAIRPATMAAQAGDKLGDLTGQLEASADAAGQAGTTGSTKPALDYLDQQIAKYQARNSPLAERVQAIRNQLTQNAYTGKAIPQDLAPRDLLEAKRGVGDLINTWEPTLKKTVNPVTQRVYGLLDAELDRTVPGADELNQRISSLIPVKQRANVVSNSSSLPQRAAHRLAAPTGALIASGIGGTAGYRQGGVPGAIAGGAAGLMIPEMLSSPTAQMAAARLATTGIPTGVARLGVAAQSPEPMTPKARAFAAMTPEQQKRYRYDPEADSLMPIR